MHKRLNDEFTRLMSSTAADMSLSSNLLLLCFATSLGNSSNATLYLDEMNTRGSLESSMRMTDSLDVAFGIQSVHTVNRNTQHN